MCPAACQPRHFLPATITTTRIVSRNSATRYQQRFVCLPLSSPEAMGKAIVPLRSNAQSLVEDNTFLRTASGTHAGRRSTFTKLQT